MIGAALLAALAAWLLVPPSPIGRIRHLVRSSRPAREVDKGWLGAVGVLVALSTVLGWPWGPVAGVVLAPWVRSAVGRLLSAAEQQRLERLRRQLPGALDLVVSALDAGRPPGAALAVTGAAMTGPVAEELELVAARLTTAADPRDVWSELSGHAVLAPVGRAVLRAETAGTAPSRIVAQLADDLRRDRHAEATRRSRSVGVWTAAPLGLCFLPAFFLVGIVPTVIGLLGTVLQ